MEDGDAVMYILASDLTCGVCALDQEPHRKMEELCLAALKMHGREGSKMTLFAALAVIREIAEIALAPDCARKGWEAVGFVAGELIKRERVLRDRAHELFKAGDDGKLYTMRSRTAFAVLKCVRAVAVKKSQCSSCGTVARNTRKFCDQCGAPNLNYDEVTQLVMKEGHRAGWNASRPNGADVGGLVAEAKARAYTRHVGKFLAEIRKRKASEVSQDCVHLFMPMRVEAISVSYVV